jgi:hypothetical protein
MESKASLGVGVRLKQVATARGIIYQGCTVLHSDAIGLVIEVERTVSDEGGNVDNVVSQILIPWANIDHVVLLEERT